MQGIKKIVTDLELQATSQEIRTEADQTMKPIKRLIFWHVTFTNQSYWTNAILSGFHTGAGLNRPMHLRFIPRGEQVLPYLLEGIAG